MEPKQKPIREATTPAGAESAAAPENAIELDLARLKGRRSTQRGKITNLLKGLKSLYTSETTDSDSLAYAIHCLEQAVNDLAVTESELEALGEYSRVEQYYADSDELLFKSRRRLSRLDGAEEGSSSSGGRSMSPQLHMASLPKLSLPKFGGDFMEWMGF